MDSYSVREATPLASYEEIESVLRLSKEVFRLGSGPGGRGRWPSGGMLPLLLKEPKSCGVALGQYP